MLDDIKRNTELEASSSDYTIPKADCFNEDGSIDKYKYLLQFPNFTKHERKMTKKKISKFLEAHSKEKYFRLEVQGQPYGLNFVFAGNGVGITAKQKDDFYHKLWEAIYGTLYEIKNFDFSDEIKTSIEIWGTTNTGDPMILYLYPNPHGTVEIKDDEE